MMMVKSKLGSAVLCLVALGAAACIGTVTEEEDLGEIDSPFIGMVQDEEGGSGAGGELPDNPDEGEEQGCAGKTTKMDCHQCCNADLFLANRDCAMKLWGKTKCWNDASKDHEVCAEKCDEKNYF